MLRRAKIHLAAVCVLALLHAAMFYIPRTLGSRTLAPSGDRVPVWNGNPSVDIISYSHVAFAIDIALKFGAPLVVIVPLNATMVYILCHQRARASKRRDSVTIALVALSVAFVILRGPNMARAVLWYASQRVTYQQLVTLYACRCTVLLNPTVNTVVYYVTTVRRKPSRVEPCPNATRATTARY